MGVDVGVDVDVGMDVGMDVVKGGAEEMVGETGGFSHSWVC